jgi:hypothetical protein
MSEIAEDKKKKTEEVEDVIIDEATLKQITDKSKEALLPEVQKLLEEQAADHKKSLTEAIAEVVAKLDKAEKKNIVTDDEIEDPVAKGLEDGSLDKEIA